MVKDSARQWTDKELEQMEKKISKIYKKSAKGITKSWTKFMSETESKVSKYQTAYDKAVESGDDSLIESTKKSLQSALTRQTLRNSYYKSMIDDVTTKLSQTNQIALAYVNNQMPSVYTKNFNFIGKGTQQLCLKNGISFNLVDEAVVKRRVLEGDIKLPKKKVDVPKDKKWNTKQLNSSVLQGILQGESMGEISKRILPVVNNNQTSAIRNARTMVTGAENQGRLDRYRDLAKRGAIIKKVWMATGDERTRDWHLSMDGQEQEIEEYFIDGLGQKLIMPADPDAPANTVYNCRCTTKSHILGFRKDDGTVNLIDYDYSQDEESLHSKEIKAEQASRTAKTETKTEERKVVNGKDISSTWTRRADQFDFTIDDIVNAQGFDGLPKVVSAEEFDNAVSESNIIMQRGYRADTIEILDEYRNQLYNGEWYIDCSVGGSVHGSGMYVMYDNGTKISDRTKNAVEFYAGNNNQLGYIETMTLDPSAKIISSQDARKLVSSVSDIKDKVYFNYVNNILDEYNLTDNEKNYYKVRLFNSEKDFSKILDASTWYNDLSNDEKNKLDDFMNTKLIKDKENISSIINNLNDIDAGSAAALYGYDAIAVENGEMIILNRTKVIIKGA